MRASTSTVWEERARDRALNVVLPLLESEGYDKIQLVDVAEKARMSLATIYKYFPSRDELLVAAVERWMDENAYQFPPLRDEPIFDALMRVYRKIFEPWEEHHGCSRPTCVRERPHTGRASWRMGKRPSYPSSMRSSAASTRRSPRTSA